MTPQAKNRVRNWTTIVAVLIAACSMMVTCAAKTDALVAPWQAEMKDHASATYETKEHAAEAHTRNEGNINKAQWMLWTLNANVAKLGGKLHVKDIQPLPQPDTPPPDGFDFAADDDNQPGGTQP